MPAQRRKLEDAVTDRQKTWSFEVKQDGSAFDLTGLSVIAKLTKPDDSETKVDGTVNVTTAASGLFNVVLANSDNDESGRWLMDIYIGTSSLEEPPNRLYAFQSWASETE